MSLAVLADHMASKGRGPDSMLIHMSPREVQGLQALAENHGGSLTINPETGLPEAGFLDKLLPTIIGFGISYISGGTIDPKTAAMIVGGVETARTGDIGKGISAGLGAYGGAGIGAGMTAAGAEAIGSQAAGQSYLSSYAPPGVLEGAGAGLSADMAYNLSQAGIDTAGTQAASVAQQAAAERIAAATPFEKLTAGAEKIAANPMGYATKDNLKNLMYAAGPAILAGANVQSKGPQTITKPGMIRPYSFDPYGGTYTAGTPYEAMPTRAAGGGLMGMNDGGYNPGKLNFAQQGEPVVRMARGGIAHFDGSEGSLVGDGGGGINADVKAAIDSAYASGDYGRVNELAQENKITAADVASTYQGFDTSGLAGLGINLYTPDTGSGGDGYGGGGGDGAPVDYFAQQFAPDVFAPVVTGDGGSGVDTVAQNYWNEQAAIRDAAANQSNIDMWNQQNAEKWAKEALTPVKYTDAQLSAFFLDPKNKDVDIQKAIKDFNADPAGVNRYIASLSSPFVGSTETKGGSGTLGIYNQMVARGIDPKEAYDALIKNDPNYKGWSLEDIQRGYNLDKGAYALSKELGGKVSDKDWVKFMDANKYSINDAAQAFGLSLKEVRDRYNAVKAAEKVVTTDKGTNTTGTGTDVNLGTATNLSPGVGGGGNTYVNSNGTITTRPDLSLGMGQVRDDYVRGGGNLGYIPYAPKTIEEFDTKYGSRLTGGSKQSYDYLTGKTPYDPTPYTKTGEIMKPYFESVGRFPENRKAKKYVFVDGKYQLNPDYVKPSYVLAGEKAAALTNQDKEPTESPGAGNKWTWNSVDKKWEATPISSETKNTENTEVIAGGGGGDANGGLMKLARGGMAGQFNLGDYSDGGRLLRGPGDGISDSIPATIGNKRPARLADGEFVVPARIVSELGNGSTEAGARKLYAMMDRVQKARRGTVGKGKVAKNSRSDKYLPA